jgi:hypothetical protein
MESKNDNDLYRKCILCDKPILADLLDHDGVCDYCRELKQTEGTNILRLTMALKKKKWKG